MSKQTTVSSIIHEYLDREGCDGLVNVDLKCGCWKGDCLVPCGGDPMDCEPAYRHVQPGSEEKYPNGIWAMWRQKEPPTPEQWDELED